MGKVKVLGLIGGLLAVSTAVFFAWMLSSQKTDVSEQLQLGLRFARRGDFETAARLAESVSEDKIKRRIDRSTRHFLLGAAARQGVESLQNRPSRIDKNTHAVEQLMKSRDLKFPPGYEGIGNYLLGMALYDLFRWGEAVEPLSIAFDRWPKGRSDAVERLIDIELYGARRDLAAALKRAERWAALSALTPSDIDRIAAKRMEIYGEQKDYAPLETLSNSISQESPVRSLATLTLSRCLRRQALAANSAIEQSAKRKQALECLKEIESLRNVPNEVRRRAILEQALLYRDAGDSQQAVSKLSSLRLSAPFEPEFMIAGIEEIDALIDLGLYSDTVGTLEQLKRSFSEPKWYENYWMPIEEMRIRLLASADRLLEKEAYSELVRFVANLPSMCVEVDRLRLEASVNDRWARKLMGDRSGDGINAEQIERAFRNAAKSIERLNQIDMRTPNYMQRMWVGIEDYHYANDFTDSNRMIERYLNLAARSDRSRPLLIRAKNHAALGDVQAALDTIDNLFLTDPDSPLLPDAKLIAAKLHWNRGNFEEAESLILDNLYSGNLRPDSPIWKESLIELGTLMFRQGEQMQIRILGLPADEETQSQALRTDLEKSYHQLLRSIASMEEGLRRFQGDVRRYQLLYMTAKAYRMASFWPETLLQGNRLISEESISQWKNKKRELLVNSRDTFASLRKELANVEEKNRVPNSEILLCNSYFGEADLLFQEGNYKGALEAYRAVANQFINEPESLEAFVQMARCHQELGQITDMRRTLEMAIDILNRIPEDREDRFLKNTRQSRGNWATQIRWMLQEIDQGTIR